MCAGAPTHVHRAPVVAGAPPASTARRSVRVIAASASMITHPPNMITLRQDSREYTPSPMMIEGVTGFLSERLD